MAEHGPDLGSLVAGRTTPLPHTHTTRRVSRNNEEAREAGMRVRMQGADSSGLREDSVTEGKGGIGIKSLVEAGKKGTKSFRRRKLWEQIFRDGKNV